MNASEPNSIALIIGGSSGIGKASARGLLRRGVAVWLVARDEDKLKQTAAELSELGDVQTTRAIL